MDHNSSAQFVSALIKSLQSLCNGYVEFNTWVQVSGTLYMQTDTGKSIEFVINEKVYKPREVILQNLATNKPKIDLQVQDNWAYNHVEALEPQGNIHDLVQAAKQAEGEEFQLVFNDGEADNDIYSTTDQIHFQHKTVENHVKQLEIENKQYEFKRENPINPKPIYKNKDVYRNPNQSGAGAFKCDICFKGFTRDSTLKIHRRLHTNERPYKCEFCPKRFNASQDLRRHKRTHTGEKPYKCRICSKMFAQYATVRRHELTHVSAVRDKPHVCALCNRGFDRKDALLRHKRLHESGGRFKCKKCPEEFPFKMELAVHKKTAHPKPPREKKIKLFVVDKAKNMKVQTKGKNEPKQTYNCSECDVTFTNKIELIIHMSKRHANK